MPRKNTKSDQAQNATGAEQTARATEGEQHTQNENAAEEKKNRPKFSRQTYEQKRDAAAGAGLNVHNAVFARYLDFGRFVDDAVSYGLNAPDSPKEMSLRAIYRDINARQKELEHTHDADTIASAEIAHRVYALATLAKDNAADLPTLAADLPRWPIRRASQIGQHTVSFDAKTGRFSFRGVAATDWLNAHSAAQIPAKNGRAPMTPDQLSKALDTLRDALHAEDPKKNPTKKTGKQSSKKTGAKTATPPRIAFAIPLATYDNPDQAPALGKSIGRRLLGIDDQNKKPQLTAARLEALAALLSVVGPYVAAYQSKQRKNQVDDTVDAVLNAVPVAAPGK
jgi:hypothetical protein